MPILSARERVVIGAGAIVSLVVGVHLTVVEPIRSRFLAASAAVPLREETLERRRRQIDQKTRLVEELAAVNERLAAATERLLRGPTASLAASELQELVKDRLATAGVEVRSERVLPVADQPGLHEIAIELTVIGTIRETVAALAGLEQTPRLLALREVRIRLVTGGQPRDLLTTLTVAGYLLRDSRPLRLLDSREG